jgi:hypothetical protein
VRSAVSSCDDDVEACRSKKGEYCCWPYVAVVELDSGVRNPCGWPPTASGLAV